MGWWIAERGSPWEQRSRLELNETSAKSSAIAESAANPGKVFQVRYHVNANAPTEVRWEALDGQIIDVSGGERMPSEGRLAVRHFACFPAHIERPGGEKSNAMIHDLSVGGALLVMRAQLVVGDSVSLQLYVTGDPADSRSRATQARVVRIEPLDAEARGLWTHKVAVQFDEPLTDFEPEIKALEARQRELGLRP
jgi:hypothetical protein